MSPQTPEATHTIVVGVADPITSQAPLQWAAEQARAFGKTLLALTAQPAPRVETWPTAPRPEESDEAHARAVLEEAVDRLGSARHGIEVRREVRRGPAVRALIHASSGADLLVLGGRRARGRFDQRPMSVAAQCIQLAACPVVVVPASRPSARQRQEQMGA